MNVVDEASSGHLQAIVYNSRTVAGLDRQKTTQDINKCFARWGLPVCIKIDNGLPFVLPKQLKIPTLTNLWWIGLGIEVIQNHINCPQENGAVECSQGVFYNWSNPKGCHTVEELQTRLDKESDFQRNYYRMPNRAKFTRIELYPELEQNARPYNPANFKMHKVDQFLSQQLWSRTVKKNGEVKIFGCFIYLGTKYAKEQVTITFDPIERKWLFRLPCGTFIKSSEKGVPKEKEIVDFALEKPIGTT
jgi:hypothetical protein